MRTINIRFLLVSAGLVAIVGIGANLLHQIQLRRCGGILLELGTQKIKEGRAADALSYLSRYASIAPHNAEAQILLADTLAEMGHVNQAMMWYEQALLRDASLHTSRRRLVELAIAARRFAVAKNHLVDFLMSYTPDDPQVYYLLGVCHEGLGEYGDALIRLREAIARDPEQVDAYALLAALLRDHQNNGEEADGIMEQLIAKNSKNATAFVTRADYRAKYRLDGMAEDVREAVRLDAEDPEILFRAAQTLQQLAIEIDDQEGILVESDEYLQKGLALKPRFAGWYLGLAQSDRSRGNLDKAIAHIEEGLSAIPDDIDLQWNLADLLIQQDRFDEGLAIVERLGDQGFDKVPLEYLLAVADARQMKFVDSSERFRKIRGDMGAWPELARQTEYWLGICYERLGEYGLQLAAFRNAVKIDPAWIPARQWLANALARTGRLNEAITEYEELTKLTGVPPVVFRELAKLLVLRELQRQHRDWPSVQRFLDKAAKVDPDADDYTILRAEIEAAQQQREAARETLKKGLEIRPDSVALRLAMASIEQAAERWDEAEQLINEARMKFGDIAVIRLARLRYVVQKYGIEAYDELLALEQDELKAPIPEKQQWFTSLAAAYYTLGKYADAGRLWQQAVDQEPDNIQLRMFLFDLALADADDAPMQTLLTNIRRIERSEERPLWRYGEATRLVVQARKGNKSALSEAERLLEEVRSVRQTWSRIPLLQAEIDEIRGEHDKVVDHYLAAIELGERSPTIIRRVVEVLYRQRRYVEADNVLRRFESTQLPITGDLGRLAADVSFRVQDFSRAMQIAVQAIGDSGTYEDLVWMGQLHSVLNEAQLAEEKFKLAIKKEPASPNAWIALVQHYVRTESPTKARLAIAALTKNVERDSAVYVEAICLDALNDIPAALERFEKAAQPPDADAIVLRVAANFYLSHSRPDKGEPLLKRLLAHASASKTDREWTRRNLAVVWAASGSDTSKKRALELIAENLRENPSSADDLRAKALCLEALGGNQNLESSLALIQSLIDRRQSKPVDYLMAFRLCLNLQRRADARRYLEQHTFENSSVPENLARYIHFVLGDNELQEARLWITRLQDLCVEKANQDGTSKQNLEVLHRFYVVAVSFEAELILKEKGHQPIVSQLTQRVDSTTNSEVSAISALEAAQILRRLSKQLAASNGQSADDLQAAAETFLRTAASRSPRNAVALVTFLSETNRDSEAVDTWNSHFRPEDADPFAICAAALAARPQLGAQDLAEMTQQLSTLPPKHRSKVVLSGLAQLFAFQNKHTEAISAFREILASDSQDITAMNNLACYLALSEGDKNEALALINTAIEIAGPAAALLDSRGLILLEMNRPQEALSDFEKAIEASASGSAYLHLAAALKRLNRNQESEEAIVNAQAAGLKVELLHPLERSRYSEFLKHAAL